jgi:DNA polymerase II small subunit/DNA polymerase delta subunit B
MGYKKEIYKGAKKALKKAKKRWGKKPKVIKGGKNVKSVKKKPIDKEQQAKERRLASEYQKMMTKKEAKEKALREASERWGKTPRVVKGGKNGKKK